MKIVIVACVLALLLGSPAYTQGGQQIPNPAYIQLTAQIDAAKEEVASAAANEERMSGTPSAMMAAVGTTMARKRLQDLISRLGSTPPYLIVTPPANQPPASSATPSLSVHNATASAWFSGAELMKTEQTMGADGFYLRSGYAAGVADTVAMLAVALQNLPTADVMKFLQAQAACFRARNQPKEDGLSAFERFAETQWRDQGEAAAGNLMLAACK
jgi:hypothetical protein